MGIIGLIKGFVLAVLIFLLVVLTPLYILMGTIQQTLFNADYLIQQFDKLDMWTQMQGAMVDLFSSQMKSAVSGTQQSPSVGTQQQSQTGTQPPNIITSYYERQKEIQQQSQTGTQPPSQVGTQQQSPLAALNMTSAGLNITDAEISAEIKNAFTTDFIKTQVSRLITNLFSYIKGAQSTLDLSISGIKSKLTTLMTNLFVKKTGLSKDIVESGLGAEVGKNVPEPLDLDKMLFQGNAKDKLAPLREGYSLFMLLMLAIPITIVLGIVLIFLITRDVREVAKMVGWPLFVSVLPLVLISYLGPSFLSNLYMAVPSGSEAPPPAQIAEVSRVLSGLFEPIFSDLFTKSLIVLVISIILVALTFVLKKKEKEKEEQKEKRKKKK